MSCRFGVALLLVLSCSPLLGQVTPPDATAQATMTLTDAQRLQIDLIKAIQQQNWDKALDISNRMIEADPKNNNAYYNLACAQARLGKSEDALANLAKSVELGFVDAAHIAADDDLVSLHQDKRFAAAVATARDREKTAPFEQGEDIDGVKTVEDFPDGGLRYRLRMSPDATVQNPNRLIIWLHPSGGSADKLIEHLAPRFLKQNFALVVFTRKQYSGWSSDEGDLLLKGTIPALAKVPGIDARKPLLLGFSAGGQMALKMYYKNPGDFGGLILDAAYPIDQRRVVDDAPATRPTGADAPAPGPRHLQISIHALPNDPSVKDVPIFVIVGGADGGAGLWKTARPRWQHAGVPLLITIVPNKGHAWLFGPEQLGLLDAWICKVAAGEKPSEAVPEAQPAVEKPLDTEIH